MTVSLSTPFNVPLFGARKVTGLGVAATAGASEFGLAVTNPGTTGGTVVLNAVAANASTITAKCLFEVTMPPEVFEASSVPLTITAKKTLAASAAGTLTLGASMREITQGGTLGAELNATAVQTVGTAESTYTFTIDTTLFGGGEVALLQLTMIGIETATHDLTGVVEAIKFG